MNNGFLRVSNKITVIASIILPIVFICGTFMTGYFVYGENIGGILFFLVYFLVTTIGFWGAMIQGLRSISNGMAKTIRSAAVFQTIMYIAHILDAVILFYSQRKSAYSGMRTFLGIFIFLFMIMIVLAAARIKIAKKCADKGAAVEGSSGFAFFIFLFCIIIPVASIVLVILGSKFVDAHPGVVKVAGITGAIIWMLICGAAFLGVFSFLDKLGFGGGGFDPSISTPTRSGPDKASIDKANKLQNLKDERSRIENNRRDFNKNNGDNWVKFKYGVNSDKDFAKSLDRVNEKIKNLEK